MHTFKSFDCMVLLFYNCISRQDGLVFINTKDLLNHLHLIITEAHTKTKAVAKSQAIESKS
jgi:hypothetical protein